MIEKFLWLFVIYAFLGWCTEVIYATVSLGKFVNRGFLSGPSCPIYGFGMLLVLIVCAPFQDNLLALFLVSLVLTSGLELVVGFILKLIFHQSWWEYNNQPFNLGGYICLKFSLIWGVTCVSVIKIIHPLVLELISKLDNDFGRIILGVVIFGFIVDLIATFTAMLKLQRQLRLVHEIDIKIKQFSDGLGEQISGASRNVINNLDELRKTHDQIFASLSQRYKRWFQVFPSFDLGQILNINSFKKPLSKSKSHKRK